MTEKLNEPGSPEGGGGGGEGGGADFRSVGLILKQSVLVFTSVRRFGGLMDRPGVCQVSEGSGE